jgi:hypothetical protein
MNDKIWFTKASWASVAVNAIVMLIVGILNMHCFFGEY